MLYDNSDKTFCAIQIHEMFIRVETYANVAHREFIAKTKAVNEVSLSEPLLLYL